MRLQPNIYSDKMPSPLKERYQLPYTINGKTEYRTRLPCDDMKVADTIVCKNDNNN